MSEHLAAAKELVRAAIAKIEARLDEMQVELLDLGAARAALLVALNGGQPEAAPTSQVPHASLTPTPAAAAPPPALAPPLVSSPSPALRHTTKAKRDEQRIVGAVNGNDWDKLQAIASRVPDMTLDICRQALQRVVRLGLVTAEGSTSSRRYMLTAKGRAMRDAPPPDSEGDRTPVSQRGLSSQRTARAAAQPNVLDSRPRHASRG
jgi:hypothetical protein